jgi:hypothetical protein
VVVSLGERTMRRRGEERRSPVTTGEVGAELREARKGVGLSLAEVHDRTGITWRDLEALEAGEPWKIPDRQSALVGLHRYAALLGLDGRPLARVLHEHWPSMATRAPGMMPFASPASNPWAPMDTGYLTSDSGDGSRLSTFNDTTRVPALGTVPPRYPYARKVVVAAPLPLRVAVWLVALLLVAASVGLAAKHGVARWLGDIHWGPAPTTNIAASQNASGTIASSASKPVVVLASSGTGSATVSVRAAQFSVVVVPTAPCWVQVTASSSIPPVFAGILQPGDEKVFDAVGGQLSMQIGAGGVTIQVQVHGQTVPGWSFRPSVAPSILNFASTSDS